MALATAQRANQTITYAELANAAKIPNPHRIHKLTKWLENSMRMDHEAGKPLRAAMVISRNVVGYQLPDFSYCVVSLAFIKALYQDSTQSTFTKPQSLTYGKIPTLNHLNCRIRFKSLVTTLQIWQSA